MNKKLLVIAMLLMLCVATVNAQWQSIGPYGGIVRCFAKSGSTLFAGSFGGGIFQSTDNGISWDATNTGLTNLDILSLAVNGTTMYAGTNGGGVFVSTNSGANWTAVNNGLTNLSINAIAVVGNTVFAGTTASNGGMFISTNNGTNWNAANNGLPSGVYVLSLATSGSVIYAGTGQGVYMSSNNGANWMAMNTGLTDLYINAIAVNGSTMFAGNNLGIFLSVNGGSSWSPVNAIGLVTSFAVNGTTVFASSGAGITVSVNNGSGWTSVNNGLTNLQNWAVFVSGSTVFTGTQGDGIFTSSDNGNNWIQSSVGLSNVNTPSLLLANGPDLFAGAFLGGVFLTSNDGDLWTKVNNGLTNTAVQALATNGTTVFAGTSGSGGGVFSTTNNGGGWTLVNNGLTNTNVNSFAISGTKTFAGTFGGGVFLSNNSGGLWTPVNNGLSNTSVQCLAINGTAVLAGTYFNGVFLSTNDGALWTPVNNGLTNLNVNAFVTSGTKVFAGTNGGVFVTKNNGSSWVPMNTGLTDLDIISFAASDEKIFAGTDGGGVFYSNDTGHTWTAINTGLEHFVIKSLAITDSNLFAGTQGGAVYIRPLSEVFRADVVISQTSGTNPTCAGASVTFTALPVNGGTIPIYQWKVNGVNDGTNSSTFTTTSLTNAQIVTCVLTSNMPDVTGSPVTSNGITMTITSSPPVPTISLSGTVLTSSAATGNQWYLEGVLIPGAVSQTYTINQNGNYTVVVTSGGCSSTSAVLTVNAAFAAGVTIAQTGGTNPSCFGQSITFTATPINGGTTPVYQWLINGGLVGTDSPVYTTTTLTSGQIVSCLMTSSMMGVTGNPATSNGLFVTVNTAPAAPSISQNGNVLTSSISSGNQWYWNGTLITSAINQVYTATQNGTFTVTVTSNGCSSTASAPVTISSFIAAGVSIAQTVGSNPACDGVPLTFTATAVNGGTTPSYQWKVNGVNAGTNSALFSSSTLTNGQIITCVLTSNLSGVTNNPATSNAISMLINTTPIPTISQSGNTLTSSAANGNQWYLDGGIISGANSQAYTATQNGSYTVISTINGCASIASSPVMVTTASVASISISQTSGTNPMCEGQSATFTATPVNGGTIPVYQWKVNGVNAGTNSSTFTTITLMTNQIVTCVLTSNLPGVSGSPATSNAITMTVNSVPPTPVISQNGILISSSAASGNLWYFNGTPIPDAFGQSYTITQNGTYTVVSTVNGCSSMSAPLTIMNIGVNELEKDSFFGLSPNPNDGNFKVSFQVAEKADYKLELRNTLGALIYQEYLINFNGEYFKSMNVSNYGKGIYLISLVSSERVAFNKIVVY
ncbi:MAG: T9SS type A sorting domain-containing protein [Bacteroidota bacterium]